jgi:DNA repair ATPase RecN
VTQQTNPLMPFLLAVLTPFLMAAGIPDPDLARQAATETINAYKATTQDQLVTTAQIIAFAFASLENLRLSAPEDLSLSMKLKLRSNANALNRASQKAAATLETQRKTPAPAPAQPDERETDLAWAAAMTDVATEYTAELPKLPPAQQRTQQSRINALSKIAQSLGNGTAPPLKDRLLASTALKF